MYSILLHSIVRRQAVLSAKERTYFNQIHTNNTIYPCVFLSLPLVPFDVYVAGVCVCVWVRARFSIVYVKSLTTYTQYLDLCIVCEDALHVKWNYLNSMAYCRNITCWLLIFKFTLDFFLLVDAGRIYLVCNRLFMNRVIFFCFGQIHWNTYLSGNYASRKIIVIHKDPKIIYDLAVIHDNVNKKESVFIFPKKVEDIDDFISNEFLFVFFCSLCFWWISIKKRFQSSSFFYQKTTKENVTHEKNVNR